MTTNTPNETQSSRGQWSGRLGFIAAAAGSSIGLGNIWKFPYITGENGGGAFVLVYLLCILLIAAPILIAEILIGRASQKGAVGAFPALAGRGTAWSSVGILGLIGATVLLSYYAVIGGWTIHYAWLYISGGMPEGSEEIAGVIGKTATNATTSGGWHGVFMLCCIGLVIGGVRSGIERAAKVLMPILALVMVLIIGRGVMLDGFGEALSFVFAPRFDELTASGMLEALGHAFFSVGIGIGTMLTYGSYLSKKEDVVGTSIFIAGADTLIAIMACLMVFPITFSFGLDPAGGPGLVFANVPIALEQLPGGAIWGVLFFGLLFFAALTSAISLLEVPCAFLIDELGWQRVSATIAAGLFILLLGLPAAIGEDPTGTPRFEGWLDDVDYIVSNWILPLGGLGVALFVGYRLRRDVLEEAFQSAPWLLGPFRFLVKVLAPVAIVAIFLNAIGVLALT